MEKTTINLMEVVTMDERACYDLLRNRVALGGLNKEEEKVTVGSWVVYREQVVTSKSVTDEQGNITQEPLHEAAYWTNRIATAAFDTEAEAQEAIIKADMAKDNADLALSNAREIKKLENELEMESRKNDIRAKIKAAKSKLAGEAITN
jgi:hypothetical protein